MNDNIPNTELPEFATRGDRLAGNVEIARAAVSCHLGYQVELACLEPVQREGQLNIRIHWRRKLPARRFKSHLAELRFYLPYPDWQAPHRAEMAVLR